MQEDVTRGSLLSRVRNVSDRAAWAEFEARHHDLILRYTIARGLQHADAEDVGRTVMMNPATALRKLSYSPQKGRFRDYLGRVARNAVAGLTGRPKDRAVELDSYVGVTLEDGDGGGDSVWEQERVDHHYRLAPRTLRETFDPRSVEVFEHMLSGKSVAEAAVQSYMSQQAVHKIKQGISDRMSELIAGQLREED